MKTILWYSAICFVFMRDIVSQIIPPAEEVDELYEIIDSDYEYGEFFEGDMELDDDQLDEIYGGRNALSEHKYKWPNATIPYIFSESYSVKQKEMVLKAIKKIEDVSCVLFKPQTNETDYVQFETENTGCHSNVGRRGGKQRLNLENHWCFKTGIIMHEILHTLGFFHMQSAANRDQYVRIIAENIRDGKELNFEKYNSTYVTDFDMEYDYSSIMHYDSRAFSKDKLEPTIVPRVENLKLQRLMGQREKLSDIDKLKINKMYKCVTPETNKGSDAKLQSRKQLVYIFILISITNFFFIEIVKY